MAHLDGWRGLAILAVLAGHFGPWPAFGAVGVELFFVLSGRLMAEILFVRRHPLPDFIRRRLSRVLPALLVFLGLMFPVAWFAGQAIVGRPLAEPIDLLAALTFTTNYVAPGLGRVSVFDHTWSLAVEEHAYLALAALAVLTGRVCKRAALGLLLAGVACMANGLIQALVFPPAEGISHGVYWRTDVRAASVFLSAATYLFLRDRSYGLGWVPAVAAAIGAGLIMSSAPLGFTAGTLLMCLSVNTLEAASPRLRTFLSTPVLVHAGVLSYSLYLWQQPFYLASQRIPAPVALLGAVIAAYLSYRLVEQPARAYLNRIAAPRKPALTQPARV